MRSLHDLLLDKRSISFSFLKLYAGRNARVRGLGFGRHFVPRLFLRKEDVEVVDCLCHAEAEQDSSFVHSVDMCMGAHESRRYNF